MTETPVIQLTLTEKEAKFVHWLLFLGTAMLRKKEEDIQLGTAAVMIQGSDIDIKSIYERMDRLTVLAFGAEKLSGTKLDLIRLLVRQKNGL